MPDLDRREAIHDLVIHFYREVAFDDLLGPVFGEVAEVDWAEHIPRLIRYWCRVLLDQPGYEGRILSAHERVHAEQRFEPELFERWYALFVASVDSGWEGPYATRAKDHAAHMAGVISRRLTGEPVVLAGEAATPAAARAERPGAPESPRALDLIGAARAVQRAAADGDVGAVHDEVCRLRNALVEHTARRGSPDDGVHHVARHGQQRLLRFVDEILSTTHEDAAGCTCLVRGAELRSMLIRQLRLEARTGLR